MGENFKDNDGLIFKTLFFRVWFCLLISQRGIAFGAPAGMLAHLALPVAGLAPDHLGINRRPLRSEQPFQYPPDNQKEDESADADEDVQDGKVPENNGF